MRLDQENHYPDDAQQARVSDLDLILASPYRPAACEVPQSEVGHTSEPDHIAKTSSKENACITRGVHTREFEFWFGSSETSFNRKSPVNQELTVNLLTSSRA